MNTGTNDICNWRGGLSSADDFVRSVHLITIPKGRYSSLGRQQHQLQSMIVFYEATKDKRKPSSIEAKGSVCHTAQCMGRKGTSLLERL